jgi:hypothetical protein
LGIFGGFPARGKKLLCSRTIILLRRYEKDPARRSGLSDRIVVPLFLSFGLYKWVHIAPNISYIFPGLFDGYFSSDIFDGRPRRRPYFTRLSRQNALTCFLSDT